MIDKFVRWQLVAFVVVTTLAVGYAAVVYVGLPALLGFGRYQVSVALPDTGGLYPRAVVTLRGVPVGQVTDVTLDDNGGVRAELAIDNGTELPVGSAVEVRSVSAIGEQYLNFEPTDSAGPVLAAGQVVPKDKVVLPIPVSQLLANINGFTATLPADELNTTVRELSTGFSGTASDLQRLFDSSGALLDTAEQNLGPTRQLIDDAEPVLATQLRTGDDVTAFADNLASFTRQLAANDASLRGSIEKTPALVNSADQLVQQIREPLPDLLTNLTAVGQVARVYLPNAAHTIAVLPVAVNAFEAVVQLSPVPGTALLNFKLGINDPPPCTKGFEADQRDPSDLTPARPAVEATCREPSNSLISVRGARNSPCPDDATSRAADASGCGLNFQSPEEAAAAQEKAIDTQTRVAEEVGSSGTQSIPYRSDLDVSGVHVPTPYDQGTGLFIGPEGQSFLFSGSTRQGSADWRSLLLGPMGIPAPS